MSRPYATVRLINLHLSSGGLFLLVLLGLVCGFGFEIIFSDAGMDEIYLYYVVFVEFMLLL